MSHSVPVLGNIFVQSGYFSYVIAALTLALVVTLVLQHLRRHRVDYGPLLWSLVAALFFAGLAGTVVGQYQFFQALARIEEGQITRLFLKSWAISIGPMVMATPMCMVSAVATGILTYRARRVQSTLPPSAV